MGIYNEDVEVNELTVGKIDRGQKYVASTGRETVTDDSSVELYIENPSTSSLDSYVVFSALPSADAEVEYSTDVTQDGTGTTLTILNAKSLSSNSPSEVVRTDDSYTVNGKTISFNIPGGSNAGSGSGGGSGQAAPSTFLLEPGVSMLCRLYNRSGGSGAIGVGATWFEVDL